MGLGIINVVAVIIMILNNNKFIGTDYNYDIFSI